MTSTGDRIKSIRDKKGWTLDKLAEESKVSKGFLSDVENNKRDISSQNLLRVANALGASIDYLLRGEVLKNKAVAPVVIPPELSLLSERLNLPYSELLTVKDAHDAIVARRSKKEQRPFSVDEWQQLYEAIKKFR